MLFKHPMCRCSLIPIVMESPQMAEARQKFEAACMLVDPRRLIVPTKDEWIGVNLMERDDELGR